MLTEAEFSKKKQQAENRILQMDEVDGDSVISHPLPMCLNTILSALECGLKAPHTEAEWDALVMLEALLTKTRKEYYHIGDMQ